MDPSTSASALKLEIARLKGAINKRKAEEARPPRTTNFQPGLPGQRSNVYVNPNYKPPSRTIPPPRPATSTETIWHPTAPRTATVGTRDVVIGGVTFEASGRSLVRKDCRLPKPAPSAIPMQRTANFSRSKAGNLLNMSRVYKPKTSARRRRAQNMTLKNTNRPYHARLAAKRAKYINKPCPRFTTTGASPFHNVLKWHTEVLKKRSPPLFGVVLFLSFVTDLFITGICLISGSCNRGLTCMYQHDPAKVAICWNYLQGNCPNTAETCNLSHDPTPERTPLCVHFTNYGRCTRVNCLFPHIKVGERSGVCRDFAVLGYCEKGIDCDKLHVRECPDFAEKGVCQTKGCKLPHVIRRNRTKQQSGATKTTSDSAATANSTNGTPMDSSSGSSDVNPQNHNSEGAQMGDEFISLTFHESESEDDDDDEEEEDGDEDEDEEEDVHDGNISDHHLQ
ncbi:hypothetical protein C8Q75DRAFT_807503 [Abortiporus biennis]|nr:hypothetical protein C8Q75DRAFT_807503 [Abortiporus biennis]